MTAPRRELVSPDTTPYYHVVSRCVRRAYLCGFDACTNASYEHRRGWALARLRTLETAFAIDICAYAIMSNHYHLIVRIAASKARRWSPADVVDRWCTLFREPPLVGRWRRGDQLRAAEQKQVVNTVREWRKRLANLSWFMRCLNEYLARRANLEDRCTGRFWEGRFKSQALLDDGALLTAMTYVDLNPIRAGMASTLESSDFTSIQQRLFALAGRPAGTRPTLVGFRTKGSQGARIVPCTLQDYVELLEAAALKARQPLGESPPTPRLLATLPLRRKEWYAAVGGLLRKFAKAVGSPQNLRALASSNGRRWYRGLGAAQALYRPTTSEKIL